MADNNAINGIYTYIPLTLPTTTFPGTLGAIMPLPIQCIFGFLKNNWTKTCDFSLKNWCTYCQRWTFLNFQKEAKKAMLTKNKDGSKVRRWSILSKDVISPFHCSSNCKNHRWMNGSDQITVLLIWTVSIRQQWPIRSEPINYNQMILFSMDIIQLFCCRFCVYQFILIGTFIGFGPSLPPPHLIPLWPPPVESLNLTATTSPANLANLAHFPGAKTAPKANEGGWTLILA